MRIQITVFLKVFYSTLHHPKYLASPREFCVIWLLPVADSLSCLLQLDVSFFLCHLLAFGRNFSPAVSSFIFSVSYEFIPFPLFSLFECLSKQASWVLWRKASCIHSVCHIEPQVIVSPV